MGLGKHGKLRASTQGLRKGDPEVSVATCGGAFLSFVGSLILLSMLFCTEKQSHKICSRENIRSSSAE